jgi:MarR family transcriptional regulator, organic hydroperoxide resistance regulator
MNRLAMIKRRMTKSDFNLERFVPYLLNRVGIRIAMEFAREIAPSHVTYSSWRVILTLAHFGPQQMVDLAALANFEISTLSRVVAGLERAGLIKRINGEDGARNRRISLTSRGQKKVKQLEPTICRHESAALSGFSAAQHEQLIALLVKLHHNLELYYSQKR